ncbi:MAG: cation transporter dimerization domain-containing protein, partial [Acutalibacteraceae bacterium]|nr:cation transporter dimerization domain-containing protein [Acutalibacteraceae bacterium]
GFSSGKQTLDEILGQPAPRELRDEIHNIIMSFDGFLGTHDLIVHNYGPGRQFASVHVEVAYSSDIVHCHEQMDLCEKLVEERLGIILVIHMDPIDVENEYVMQTRSQIALAVANLGEGLTIHDFRMTPKGDERTNLIFDVVVPANTKRSHEQLQKEIGEAAKKIDPTFCCVITFDSDFTAH